MIISNHHIILTEPLNALNYQLQRRSVAFSLATNVRGGVMRQLMGCVRGGASDPTVQRRAAAAVASLCLAESLAGAAPDHGDSSVSSNTRQLTVDRNSTKSAACSASMGRPSASSSSNERHGETTLSDRVMKNLLLYLRKRPRKDNKASARGQRSEFRLRVKGQGERNKGAQGQTEIGR